jgi:hypothetical protein
MKLEISKRYSQLGEPYYCVLRDGEYVIGTRVFIGGVISEDDAVKIVTEKYRDIKTQYESKQPSDKTLYSEEL